MSANVSSQMDGHSISIFLAGDDASAKQKVKEIVERLAFEAIDAGPRMNARYLEPLSFLNIQLGRMLGYGTQIGFSLLRKSDS